MRTSQSLFQQTLTNLIEASVAGITSGTIYVNVSSQDEVVGVSQGSIQVEIQNLKNERTVAEVDELKCVCQD
jgi:hypothetical protein